MYSNIKNLVPNNFSTNGKLNHPLNKGTVIILFYATWCTYCAKMEEEYIKFARLIKEKNLGEAVVFNFDAVKTTIPNFFQEFPYVISGYPSIIFYNDSNPCSKYDGLRTSDALLEFITLLNSQSAICAI